MPSQTEIATFQDLVEHLIDLWNLDWSGRDRRMARRAVLDAYRELPNQLPPHGWSYYQRRLQVITEASQTTGSVSFDMTGGTYERMLTLSGSTWPTNAAFGRVVIANTLYDIEDRKSSTIITLPVDSNPGADVAAGTTYTWHRSTYPLPVRFRRASPLVEIATSYWLDYVTPRELLDHLAGNYQPSRPYLFTYHSGGEYYGGMSVEFAPPSSDARTYDFMADVAPRDLMTEVYDTGTVTVTAGSTTVTGSSTAFGSAYEGAIIRFSSNGTTAPTGRAGSMLPTTTDGVLNPYFAQRVVSSVTNTTSLIIDTAASSSTTLTAVKYTISDPLDLEAGAMLNYFYRLAEYHMARLVKDEKLAEKRAVAHEALIEAAAADNRNIGLLDATRDRAKYYWRLRDWAIIQL